MIAIASSLRRTLFSALSVSCLALTIGTNVSAQEVTAATLVDRLQIQDLITRYYNNFGRENAENFADFYAPDAELIRLLRAAQRSRPSADIDAILLHTEPEPARAPVATFGAALTEREQALLALLPTHLTYREMADRLCISVNTVKTNQKALYRKLQVATRSDVVRIHVRTRR